MKTKTKVQFINISLIKYCTLFYQKLEHFSFELISIYKLDFDIENYQSPCAVKHIVTLILPIKTITPVLKVRT